MHIAAIGFGSNMGDRKASCREGLRLLAEDGRCRVTRVSRLYLTEPQDYADQDEFVNGAALVETELAPAELLALLKRIEAAVGRTPGGVRFGPRVLDMDILFYGEMALESPELVLPHPRMDKRRFVLMPLCDIMPDWTHPVSGKSARELLGALGETGQKVTVMP